MGYIYILGTVLFTVYGQLIMKWRIVQYGALPIDFSDKVIFLFKLIFDPYIFSGFISAFIASLFWMGVMTKFELSYAYPFMSGAFILVFVLSIFLFHETITLQKIIGLILITTGILITSRSL